MRDFKVLKILDKLKLIFNKMDIDYIQLRRILQVKLILDSRRVPTIIGNSKKSKNEEKNYFLSSLWFYLIMGLFLIVFVFIENSYIFSMSIIFGILMFLVSTSMISDFSSVLLDLRDKNIILTKPVNNKTLNMAKIIHIFFYMFFITCAIVGPVFFATFLKYLIIKDFIFSLLFCLVFLMEIILMDLFIIILTTLLYLFILKFFDGEKLKDIINYVQILLSITLAVGYQLIGRLFDVVSYDNINFIAKWWQYFIVPIWFGAPFELLFKGDKNIYFITFSLLALIVPVISFIVYIKLIPTFEQSLQKLNNNNSKVKNKQKNPYNFFVRMIIRNKEERIFYRFALNMMKNERDFKLKVYPSLGFSLIFPFIFLLNTNFTKDLSNLSSSKLYLYIYFCAFMLPSAVMMLKYSVKYKGAWVYKVTPISDIRSINKGALKAFIIRLLVPIYVVESIIFLILFSYNIIPDLIIVFLTMLIFLVICYKIVGNSLPFSEAYENVQQSQGIIVLGLMMLIGIFVLIHFLSTLFMFGVYIYLVIIFILNLVVWKLSFRENVMN